MKNRVIVLLMAIALVFTFGSVELFATGPDGAVSDSLFDLEVSEISSTGAELNWRLKEGEEFIFDDDTVFSFLSGDALIKEVTLATEENEDGYTYDSAEGFGYALNELQPNTEYNLELYSGETFLGEASFTTKSDTTKSDDGDSEDGDSVEYSRKPALMNSKVETIPAVTGFVATAGRNMLNLSWSAVAGIDGYIVTWNGNGKSGTEEIAADKTSWSLKNVTTARTYSFSIVAFKGYGDERILSPKATAKGFVSPIVAKIKKKTATQITISWTVMKAYNKGSYTIYMVENTGNRAVKNALTAPLNKAGTARTGEFTVKQLKPGVTYSFFVRDVKTGMISERVYATTPMRNVTGFRAISTHQGVILKWNKAAGSKGYEITWKGGNGKKGTIRISGISSTTRFVRIPSNTTYAFYIKATSLPKGAGCKSAISTKCTGSPVRTMLYRFTFATGRTLYSHTGGSVEAYFGPGTTKTAVGFSQGRYEFWHNGLQYYVNRISTKNASIERIDTGRTYTKTEAESFVNRLGLSSSTGYLIWGNTYTQKMYIFEGSKGNWKLIQGPWSMSSGTASTPTATGLTSIRQKSSWENGVPWWNVCSYFSIHGRLGSWEMGYPHSNGCMRNTNDHAKFVYNNCRIGTSVYVF